MNSNPKHRKILLIFSIMLVIFLIFILSTINLPLITRQYSLGITALYDITTILKENGKDVFQFGNGLFHKLYNDGSMILSSFCSNHASSSTKRYDIALIEPTFTSAAYKNAFYVFYKNYQKIPAGKKVTADLDKLTSHVSTMAGRSTFAMLHLLSGIRRVLPEAKVTLLTDEDADAGNIFLLNGTNAYDVIILGHQEYVTLSEYHNLKRFVANGGAIMILDGNVFYAQVKFDRNSQTITLVKGHGWEYDGKAAQKAIEDRWAKETSQWVGSNYFCFSCKIKFGDNPFGYKHHEEQFVTNTKDLILFDYKATVNNNGAKMIHAVVATYELNFKKGRVIVLGIYADDVISNSRFDTFFDSLLLK